MIFAFVLGTHSPFDDYEVQRKFLSNMAQCFVQLVHKAQTIFQVIRSKYQEMKISILKMKLAPIYWF